MTVTIKLKQGRCMTIKMISTTPTWSHYSKLECKTKCKQDNYNSVVNKQR